MNVIEGTVPNGWTQQDHDAYWDGFHKGEAHANYANAYGATSDLGSPLWVQRDETLAMRWESGYGDGKEAYEQELEESESSE